MTAAKETRNCLYCYSESQQVSCEGSGHIVVKFKSYSNPTHRRSNGKCCDFNLYGCSACDAYFKLCVADSALRFDCNVGRAATGVIGKEDNHRSINIKEDFSFESFIVSTFQKA